MSSHFWYWNVFKDVAVDFDRKQLFCSQFEPVLDWLYECKGDGLLDWLHEETLD